MIKQVADLIMRRRAERLFRILAPTFPSLGKVADIGSGTGHNAEVIQNQTALEVTAFDVEDLHWVGPAPRLIRNRVPAEDHSFTAAMLLYVLQYPEDLAILLSEASRISSGPVIVLQSSADGFLAQHALRLRELCFGRLAFRLARLAGLVPKSDCPLKPNRYFRYGELVSLFRSLGFSAETVWTHTSPVVGVRRNLFVLVSQPSPSQVNALVNRCEGRK